VPHRRISKKVPPAIRRVLLHFFFQRIDPLAQFLFLIVFGHGFCASSSKLFFSRVGSGVFTSEPAHAAKVGSEQVPLGRPNVER
jgi:Na+/H+-translocating membrane pyrophosphatase